MELTPKMNIVRYSKISQELHISFYFKPKINILTLFLPHPLRWNVRHMSISIAINCGKATFYFMTLFPLFFSFFKCRWKNDLEIFQWCHFIVKNTIKGERYFKFMKYDEIPDNVHNYSSTWITVYCYIIAQVVFNSWVFKITILPFEICSNRAVLQNN